MPHELNKIATHRAEFDEQARKTLQQLPTDQATLGEIARGLAATVQLVQALHQEVKDFAIGNATLRLTITTVEEVVKELRKAITASDPASLTIRLVILEREVEGYKEWKKEQEAKEQHLEQERIRSGMQFKLAITTSVIGFVGSLLITLLAILLRR